MVDEESPENPQEIVALTPATSSNSFKWTVPKLMAISSLIEGAKNEDIARQLNISISTLYEWKRNAEFQRELMLARETIRERLLDKQTRYAEEGLEKIHTLMESGNNRQRVQLEAAAILAKALPIQKETQRDEGDGAKVKVVILNNTTLVNRKDELKEWEGDMGYDTVIPPKLTEYQLGEGTEPV